MRRILLILGISLLGIESVVMAQDAQFSQFYAAPLYLNPALTGGTNQTRIGLNYRSQWPAIDATFTSTSLFIDHFLEDYNSGVGLIISRDMEGLAGLRSLSVGAQYSYEMKITKNLGFRPGVQVGLISRDINFNKLTFQDQFSAFGSIDKAVSDEFLTMRTGEKKTVLDLSFGGLFFTKRAWLGASVWHITQPNQSLIGETNKLPMKLSVHGGFKYYMKPGVVGSGIYARNSERSIAPAFQYRHQGYWDQMDLGLYFTFEPLVIGTWYRGVPFKKLGETVNNESLVLSIGFLKLGGGKSKDALNIGYSYDYTISKLGPQSGGAHEFSLVYTWSTRDPRKPPKDKLIIPCPDF